MENKFKLYYSYFISQLLFLFPFLVFFTQQDFSNYLLVVFAITFLIKFISDKNPSQIMSRGVIILFVICIAFFIWHVLSIILHGMGNWYHGYYYRLLLIVPLYYLLVKEKVEIANINQVLAVTIWFSLMVGIYQHYYLKYPRAGFPFILNHSYYPINWGDTVLLISVYLASYTILYKPRQNLLYYITAFVGLVCLFLSGSRGGLIGLPFVGLIWLLNSKCNFQRKLLLIAGTIIICLILLLIGFKYNLFRIADAYTDLYSCYYLHQCLSYSSTGGDNSLGLRLEMWHSAWLLFKAHPLTGTGIGNYTNSVIGFANQGVISDYFASRYNEEPHSELMRMLAMLGLPGLIGYLLLIFYPLRVVKDNKKVFLLASSVLILFLGQSLSQALLIAPLACNILIYLIAVGLYVFKIEDNKRK